MEIDNISTISTYTPSPVQSSLPSENTAPVASEESSADELIGQKIDILT